MSTSLVLRPLPILLAAAILVALQLPATPPAARVAAGSRADEHQPGPRGRPRLTRHVPMGAVTGRRRRRAILADVPIGAGWDPS